MAKSIEQAQKEIDSLREELRVKRHQLEAAEREVAAVRSGKPEARHIAESAEVLAAERDQWRQRFEDIAPKYADLSLYLHYHTNGVSPPPDLTRRVLSAQSGRKLENGVPAKVVAG